MRGGGEDRRATERCAERWVGGWVRRNKDVYALFLRYDGGGCDGYDGVRKARKRV